MLVLCGSPAHWTEQTASPLDQRPRRGRLCRDMNPWQAPLSCLLTLCNCKQSVPCACIVLMQD